MKQRAKKCPDCTGFSLIPQPWCVSVNKGVNYSFYIQHKRSNGVASGGWNDAEQQMRWTFFCIHIKEWARHHLEWIASIWSRFTLIGSLGNWALWRSGSWRGPWGRGNEAQGWLPRWWRGYCHVAGSKSRLLRRLVTGSKNFNFRSCLEVLPLPVSPFPPPPGSISYWLYLSVFSSLLQSLYSFVKMTLYVS